MRIENAIVCDEVRKEASNKHILIGVYPYNILVPEFPAFVRLTLWVQLFVEHNGTFDMGVRVTRGDGGEILSALTQLNVNDCKNVITITFPPMPIELANKGSLHFQVRQHKKRWKTVKSLDVALQ